MSLSNYYDNAYLYFKIIPKDETPIAIITVATYNKGKYYLYERGDNKPYHETKDYNEIISVIIDTISKYKGFKNFEVGYYKSSSFKVPEQYKYILSTHCDYEIEETKNISFDEVNIKLKKLFIGLRVLDSVMCK